MQNSKSPVGTTDEKSTNVEGEIRQPNLNKTNVSCRYLILSGEGNIDTEHQFCADFDDIDKCNAFFDHLKAGEFKDTYLYIYEAVKLREA